MFQQAIDLKEEGDDLYGYLKKMKADQWAEHTPFNNWTVNQVVQHLHGTDKAAVYSLKDPDGFRETLAERGKETSATGTTVGKELMDSWWSYFNEMCELLGNCDPSTRVPWFGPDMGVRMFTTARQMEMWSHTQDIYDLHNHVRTNTDRLKNVVQIGVRTFGWTFANRQMSVPEEVPYVKLDAPSGATWEWGEPDSDNCVEGSAVEFCHVVTQGRNIAEVNLKVVGKTAEQWMTIAQCFAGPPKEPPAAGLRNCEGYLQKV